MHAPSGECSSVSDAPSQGPFSALFHVKQAQKCPNPLPVGARPCARMSEQTQQAFKAQALSNPLAISPFGRRGGLPQIPESLPVGARPCARISEQAQQAFKAKASSNPSATSPFGRRGGLPQEMALFERWLIQRQAEWYLIFVGACPCARMSEQAQQAFKAKASSNPLATSPFGRRGSLPQIPESPARHSHNTFGRRGSLPQMPKSPPRGSAPLRANF